MTLRSLIRALPILAAAALARDSAGRQGRADTDPAPAVTAVLEPKELSLGESALLRVVVDGVTAREIDEPAVPVIDGAEVEPLGPQDASSRSISIINGRRTETVLLRTIFNYRVTPTRPGRLAVPSVSVGVRGVRLRSEPLTLAVVAPDAEPGATLALAMARTRVYVGEATRLRMSWRLSGEVRDVTFTLPVPEGCEVVPASPPEEALRGTRIEEVALNGASAPAWLERGDDGAVIARLDALVIVRRAGEAIVGPARADFGVVVGGSRVRSWLDDPFAPPRIRRAATVSAPVTLSAVPLPQDGRPGDFSGVIGALRIETFPDDGPIVMREPIGVVVRFSGVEAPQNIPIPDLKAMAGFERSFRIEGEPQVRVEPGEPGAKLVRWIVVPKSFRVREFPAIRITYFDPERGVYDTATSDPAPMRVLPAPAGADTSADAGASLPRPSAGLLSNGFLLRPA